MTINGPAPILLAFFLNAAIDQQVERYLEEQGKAVEPLDVAYRGELPEGHNGFGLGTVGRRGDEMVDAETYAEIKARTLSTVRGTVQADILKEDQAQNTCIFSTPFALKLMGDVQQYYIDHNVRNHYSVSIAAIILQKQVPTPSRNSPLHSQTALPTSNTIEVEVWTSTSSHPTSPSSSAMDWIQNTPSLVVLLDVSGLLPCVTCTEQTNAPRN